MGQIAKFQEIQVETASAAYHPGAMRCIQFLRTLVPALLIKIELQTYCAFYDLAVQQNNLSTAADQIKSRIERERPTTQKGIVMIAVEERAKKARPQYVSDCMSRRLGILQQSTFNSIQNGISRSRANANFSLISKDAEKYVCSL